MDKVVVQSFVSLLLVGDRLGCSKMVKQYVQESFSIKEVYEKLIKSALYEIGILWEQNKISVADEHLATSISEAILNELYTDVVSEYRENKQVVLACVDGETHQVGLKMVADVFEMNGWDAKYLGSSVPASELIKIIDKFQPEIVGISFSIYFHFDTLKKMVYSIRQD